MNQSNTQHLPAANHPKADEVKKQFIYVKALDEWRDVLGEFYLS